MMSNYAQDKSPKGIMIALAGGLATSYASGFVLGKVVNVTLSHQFERFDNELSTGVRDRSNRALDPVMGLLSAAGEPWTLYPLTGIVALRWLTQDRAADSATLAAALTGSAALNKLIKLSVRRPRPRLMIHRQKSSGSGFPSNHSIMSLATYGAIALLITRRQKRKPRREQNKQAGKRSGAVRVWAPVLAMCTLISWSRVYQGVHHPSDVLGGWVVGGIWLAACGAARGRMKDGQK